MKQLKVFIICSLLASSLYAADDGNQSTFIGRARSAIASKDQSTMDEQLRLLASFSDSDVCEAMQLLLDAGANGAYAKTWTQEDFFGPQKWAETPLITAALTAPENIRVLREWSESHENTIDPNDGGNQSFDCSLLGRVITQPTAHSTVFKKVLAVQALLQFSHIEVDKKSKYSQTPLFHAVENSIMRGQEQHFESHFGIVKLLVEHGAEVTGRMIEKVQAAKEKLLSDHHQQLIEALSPGSAIKAARKQ